VLYDNLCKADQKGSMGFEKPIGFSTGREWDKETGLYYYRARYYDPMEGRFVSKDPISFAGGDVNLYGYVLNNPINYVDPKGLEVFLFGRQPYVFRPWTRLAPNQRYIPRQCPLKETPPRPPINLPPEPINPVPETWWGKVFKTLSDLMSEFGFGSNATTYVDPLNPPREI
jgi:RHS repeat-associated protein